MSIPLHLKYRPQKLAELVGQEIVERTLINSINARKIATSYLLTGTRGCGKTSTARIIAKSLNCQQSSDMTVDPCGTCTNCREISESISPDVIEIDAASHRGVDDIESIIERCSTPPQTGRFRIYILDEVHMLSKQAFNALLKLIEEPPPKLVFIFATTEEHKVLPTIVSRCQKFTFRPIREDALKARLQHVCQLENINIDDAALSRVIQMSRGGLRDALSMLDQVSIFSLEGAVTEPIVISLFGGLSADYMRQLLDAMMLADEHGIAAVTSLANNLLEHGSDPIQAVQNIIEFAVNQLEEYIRTSDQRVRRLVTIIDSLTQAEGSIRNANNPMLKLKTTLIAASITSKTPAAVKPASDTTAYSSAGTVPPTPATAAPTPANTQPPQPATIQSSSDLRSQIDSIGSPIVRGLLQSMDPQQISRSDNEIVLGIAPNKKALLDKITDKHRATLSDAFAGRAVRFEIRESIPIPAAEAPQPEPVAVKSTSSLDIPTVPSTPTVSTTTAADSEGQLRHAAEQLLKARIIE